MMKFRSLSWAVLAAGFLFACSTDALLQEEILETPAGAYPSSLYETGHVRIYVEPALAEKLELTGSPDALITTKAAAVLGKVRMERTFPYAGKFEKRTREAGLDRCTRSGSTRQRRGPKPPFRWKTFLACWKLNTGLSRTKPTMRR